MPKELKELQEFLKWLKKRETEQKQEFQSKGYGLVKLEVTVIREKFEDLLKCLNK